MGYRQCPTCGKRRVQVRSDGTLGQHFTPYRARERFPCTSDERPPRREVVVTFHVSVPVDWTQTQVTRWARSLLSTDLLGADASAVRVEVTA